MEVECDLSIDADAKIVIHVELAMRQPVHVQSSCCVPLYIDQPAIQLNWFSTANLLSEKYRSYTKVN